MSRPAPPPRHTSWSQTERRELYRVSEMQKWQETSIHDAFGHIENPNWAMLNVVQEPASSHPDRQRATAGRPTAKLSQPTRKTSNRSPSGKSYKQHKTRRYKPRQLRNAQIRHFQVLHFQVLHLQSPPLYTTINQRWNWVSGSRSAGHRVSNLGPGHVGSRVKALARLFDPDSS